MKYNSFLRIERIRLGDPEVVQLLENHLKQVTKTYTELIEKAKTHPDLVLVEKNNYKVWAQNAVTSFLLVPSSVFSAVAFEMYIISGDDAALLFSFISGITSLVLIRSLFQTRRLQRDKRPIESMYIENALKWKSEFERASGKE